MRKWTLEFGALAATSLLAMSYANAATICADSNATNTVTRTWALDPASGCAMGGGNPQAADILAAWPATAWTPDGDITSNGDTSSKLDITITSGAFGSTAMAGNWFIDQTFWYDFSEAVISMHVGGNPSDSLLDNASFLIVPGSTTGTFSYAQVPGTGAGGGFSNFHLWGRGPALCDGPNDPRCDDDDSNPVPEPGPLALLGLGLAGLGWVRRRKTS